MSVRILICKDLLFHIVRQCFNGKARFHAHNIFTAVDEFPYVAGPFIVFQGIHYFIGNIKGHVSVVERRADEHDDIFPAFPQRRNTNRQNIEPIVEVFSKGFLRHQLIEVAIGCGNDADIDGDALRPPDTDHFTFLQHPKELDLCIE
ncbi:hypothetical protein SDC9_137323 [bioreactor metagenome]|uniref:Uncharacterized protein n=1 Tax=bioreactor metagenome TaxID=1076179 RepID=A0A645DLK0_9ZZZZ